MKILLITDYLPTINNFKGPSSLCFYLIKELAKTNEVKVITTNSNKVPTYLIQKAEQKIGIKYDVYTRNIWMKLIISKYTGFLFSLFYGNKYNYYPSRYKLSRRIMKKIDFYSPNMVIIYPYELINVVKQLSKYHPIVIGPDCQVLGILRSLRDSFVYSKNLQYKYSKAMSARIRLENDLSQMEISLALVGKEDSVQYNICTKSDKSFFLPHPHFDVKEKQISFEHAKLKVVITGAYDYATYSDINKICIVLKSAVELKNDFIFTFIGNSWKPIVDELKDFCNIVHIPWVEDYSKEIIKHDIQIVPISQGLGTKGKTLDAMANGLLCIGSYYAMENVACENGKNCIIYKDAFEIVEILKNISNNRDQYVKIAEQGRIAVRKYHSPELCSKILLNTYVGNIKSFNEKVYLSDI